MAKSFLKNKHIIASMLIAPILAILAWYAVDAYVAEVPHKLRDGQHYSMVVQPSCRWGSGKCELVNNQVRVAMALEDTFLELRSSVPLSEVKIALVDSPDTQSQPKNMTRESDTIWRIQTEAIGVNQYLQLAMTVEHSMLFAVVPTIWTQLEEMPYAR